MTPLVSVLIPCYNAERWLAATLTSVLNQTWPAIEVIVVDDGSRDNSLAIAQQFAAPQVKILSQPNRGQSAAENHALAIAQGDFIQYLDADDLLHPTKIEQQVERLQHHPDSVAAGEWGRFYDSIEDATFKPEPVWHDLTPLEWLLCSWEGGGMMHGAAWLIPRPVITAAGPWNEKLSLINDFDYFSRILLASQGVQFCWGSKSYYRSGNPTSLSGAKSRAAWESALLSLTLGTQTLLAREDSLRTRHACATVFQRFVYDAYPQVPDLVERAETLVRHWGGSDLQPQGGRLFHLLTNHIGWKPTRRLQRLVSR